MLTTAKMTDRQSLLTATQVLVFAGLVLTTQSPFLSPILVGGAVAVQAFWVQRDHGDLWAVLKTVTLTRGWIAIAAFIGYLMLRLFPVIEPEAIPGLVSMILFTVFMLGAVALFPRQNADVQQAIARAMLIAFGIAAALHVFEMLSGFALRRLLWTWAPIFRPRAGKIDLDGGSVRVLVPFIANQTSAMLVALVWPMLLLGTLVRCASWQRSFIWLSAALAVTGLVLSDQVTSKMAVVVGGMTWLTVVLLPRSARPTLTLIWLASTILVLPAVWYLYQVGGYKFPPNFSAQHRIVIWGVTAEKTLQHPSIGIGTGRTPEFDDSTHPDVSYVSGTKLPIGTNRHAHNVFLQTWYEGGAVGIALLTLAGFPIIGWIARAPLTAQPLLAAAFASAVMSASFSYSLLAAWFLATFAITALFCRFALSMADGPLDERSGA